MSGLTKKHAHDRLVACEKNPQTFSHVPRINRNKNKKVGYSSHVRFLNSISPMMKRSLSPFLLAVLAGNLAFAPAVFASDYPEDNSCARTITNAFSGEAVTVANRPVISPSVDSMSGSASGMFTLATYLINDEGAACSTPVEIVGFKAKMHVIGAGDTSWADAAVLNTIHATFNDTMWEARRVPGTESTDLQWSYATRGNRSKMTLGEEPITFNLLVDASSAPAGEEFQIALTEITYRVNGRVITESLYIPGNPVQISE